MPARYHPRHWINHPGKPQDQQVSDQCQDLQPGGAVQPRSERKLRRSTQGGKHLDACLASSLLPPGARVGQEEGKCCLTCQFPGFSPNLLNQNLRRWPEERVFNKSSRCSCHLIFTRLEEAENNGRKVRGRSDFSFTRSTNILPNLALVSDG